MLAFLKAIPGIITLLNSITKLIKMSIDFYEKTKKQMRDKKTEKKKAKNNELNAQLKRVTSDEERRKLLRKISSNR